MKEEDEPEEEEEDELGHAETYAEYMPMKCEYKSCVGLQCRVLCAVIIRQREKKFKNASLVLSSQDNSK